MSLTANTQLTLVELAKNIAPNGQLHRVAQIFTQTNRMLEDIPWFEANDIFGHKAAQESSEPVGSRRMLNDGVPNEDVQTTNLTFGTSMVETFCTSDCKLVDASPSPETFRNNRAARFVRGMGKTFQYSLIYDNAALVPGEMTGFAPMMGTLNTRNILGAGGSGGDTTSVYVVQWGEGKAYCVHPRGSKVGVYHEDLGRKEVAGKTAGTLMMAYRDHFGVDFGLVVEDPKAIGRYANIELTGTSNTFDEDQLIGIMDQMIDDWSGAAIYVGRRIMTQMRIALKNKYNVNFGQMEGLGGVPVLTFQGVPVRRVDQIKEDETVVS